MNTPDWFHPVDCTDLRELRKLPVAWRWLFVELFGGDTASKMGLADVRPALLADEAGMDRATVDEAIAGMAAAGIIVYDVETRRAYHRGHLLRHGPGSTSKHYKGWASVLDAMGSCRAVAAAKQELAGIPCTSDSLSVGVPKTTPAIATGTGTGTATTTIAPTEHAAPAEPRPPEAKQDKPQPPNLISLYNNLCPSLARCAGKPGSAAAKAAAAAWKREPDAEAWAVRFRRAEASPHCTGANDRGWKADLLWLLDAKNAEKVDAGRYDARRPRSAPPLPLTPIAPPPPTTKPPDPDADLDDPTSERAIAWAALRERWPLAMRWVNFRGGKFPTVQEARDKLAEIIAKEPEERAAADAKAAAARAKEAQEREWGLRP